MMCPLQELIELGNYHFLSSVLFLLDPNANRSIIRTVFLIEVGFSSHNNYLHTSQAVIIVGESI